LELYTLYIKIRKILTNLIHLGAGPSFIPEEVKKAVINEIEDFSNSRMSALEISHRSKEFSNVILESEEGLREVLGIPSNFFVIFIQGGATFQNTCIPMNFSDDDDKLGYVVSGAWSNKTHLDGSKLRQTEVLFNGESTNYTSVPLNTNLDKESSCRLIFLTSNETINGVQIKDYNNIGDDLVIDMSSDIASKKVSWENITCAYAGAQKNLGTAGVTIVIGKKDKLVNNKLASYLDFNNHINESSLYNTPPVVPIIVLNQMIKWIKMKGGVEYFQKQSIKKANTLYEVLDTYKDSIILPVEEEARSFSNVVFNFKNQDILERFLIGAKESNFHGIAGHRSVGGVRVSIYNSIDLVTVNKLVNFINNFMKNLS